jgi:hypothetical protein
MTMNSAELHPDIFTGYCFDFRTNIIKAVIHAKVTQNEMCKGGNITMRQFSRWMNTKEEPEVEEIGMLIEFLKERGYEWK